MKLLICILSAYLLTGCAQFIVGKNCNYAYREINHELEKTELSVCEKP